ncbi:hypothetical protein C5Y96_07100 [Blastopirellula marina]|uniref:PIN-like domain-containing protein n=1 Tax=Blastopirellula marina TaxID=124 RepID=A0A2S8FXL7_9BACT|nr:MULTISPECIES: PIN domain-containing protein [Pirellulaceae]PQO36922.1 hypothetical protein C5Y96_07100 [Blastopirellula marina]RCS53637.1 hypothetical protein DTL36_07110 [Bremerella cremea]
MIWGFVDYENLGSLKGIAFKQYQKLFIFCGPKNPNINLGDATVGEFLKIEVIKLKSTGSNNLDFHIAYYLGKFSETAAADIQFHVISRDHGFDGLVSHIKKTGRACQRTAPANGEKKTGFSACADLAVERLRHTDGRTRPRKEKPLINWIASQCHSKDSLVDGKTILAELVSAGLIQNENSVIKYKLKP